MKASRIALIGLMAAFPVTVMATIFISETVSVPIEPRADATVDEISFEWANAMALAAADPCASYLAPRYNSGGDESHYDDYGNDLRL